MLSEMLVRIANRDVSDQTYLEAVWSGPALFVYAILADN